MTTQFIPPHPNPQNTAEVCANRLAAIKAGAIKYRTINPEFVPITHWAELTKQAESEKI